MTHIEQVNAALSDLIGRPFEPSRGQNTKLRDGETTDAVIASLPVQIEDRRGDIAKQLSEALGKPVPVDVIEPWMVVHLLRLDMPLKGFSDRSAWRELRPDALIQIGMALQGDWWRDLYLTYKGAEPDAEGLAWWKETATKLFREGI